jgi:hypothetical protein
VATHSSTASSAAGGSSSTIQIAGVMGVDVIGTRSTDQLSAARIVPRIAHRRVARGAGTIYR